MKITKFQLAVLSVLLIVTIIYFVSFARAAADYYADIEIPDDPDLGKAYADPISFNYTEQARPYIMVGIVLFVSWCVALYPPNRWKTKKILAVVLLFCIGFMAFSTRVVLAHEWIVINVLCLGDEEFMSEENRAVVEWAIHDANCWTRWLTTQQCFHDTFNVHFNVLGWMSWDSKDSETRPKHMAAEIINETAWLDGIVYDGKHVHMLFACTGQDIQGYYGVTWPDANLTLMETNSARHLGCVKHELSHQFHCPECLGVCVMNVGWARGGKYPSESSPDLNGSSADMGDPSLYIQFFEWDWCSNCEAWINAHKYKWPEAAEHSHGGSSGGRYFYKIP